MAVYHHCSRVRIFLYVCRCTCVTIDPRASNRIIGLVVDACNGCLACIIIVLAVDARTDFAVL